MGGGSLSSTSHPAGCYQMMVDDSGGRALFFNTHSVGRWHALAVPVCHQPLDDATAQALLARATTTGTTSQSTTTLTTTSRVERVHSISSALGCRLGSSIATVAFMA